MRWALGTSLRFSRLVVALAIGVMVFGITQLRSAPVDVYPEFTPPSVEIQAEALGLSAAEVEQLITVPLEQDLLNGVPWLDHIHSSSMPGLSAIDLTFQPGTDLYAARQMVQERMTQAHALPNVGSPPIMIQPLASASRVAMIGLSSRSVSAVDMSVLARWKIRPRLMGVPGVANVSIYGQRDRQLQVQVDPRRLHANGVSLTRVIETTGQRPVGFAPDVRRGVDPGHWRLRRLPQPAASGPAHFPDHEPASSCRRSRSRALAPMLCGWATSPPWSRTISR